MIVAEVPYLGADDLENVVAFEQQPEHTRDHAQRRTSNDAHDGGDDCVEEDLGLCLDSGTSSSSRLAVVLWLVEERDEREGLFGGEMSQRSGKDAFALEDGDEGDERMRHTRTQLRVSQGSTTRPVQAHLMSRGSMTRSPLHSFRVSSAYLASLSK